MWGCLTLIMGKQPGVDGGILTISRLVFSLQVSAAIRNSLFGMQPLPLRSGNPDSTRDGTTLPPPTPHQAPKPYPHQDRVGGGMPAVPCDDRHTPTVCYDKKIPLFNISVVKSSTR